MKTSLIPVALLVTLFSTVVWWQAAQLELAAKEREEAYTLLKAMDTHIGTLEASNKRVGDAVKDAIATPASGHPNCAAEPISADAVRLIKPHATTNNGRATGSDTASVRNDATRP
ncbi:hypothetical protein [Aeromonas sp.]|uniref:hypothetical protein n=1 Tax=Aeromonas sp. TaxID=647 RepID=UPI002584086C|nr:hypothetical protein [Aeromonas sp.]MCX7132479.1 hypothetical protein [Aeromonas sp.]